MNIGIGTYAMAWSIGVPGYDTPDPMDIFRFMDFAHKAGVSLVQIADNIPLHRFSDSELLSVKQRAADLQMKMEVGARGLSMENMDRYLSIASYLGSPILRIVIDSRDYTPSLDEVKRMVRDLVPFLERSRIKLAIENHDRLKSVDFVQMVESAESDHVGICLDTVNSIGADEGFDTVFKTLAPYTINLHLKDYKIQRKQHMMGFDIYGMPAGQGMLPVPRLLKELKKYGKTSSIILELWPPQEKTIGRTIEKEQKWVVESLAYLRTLEL